MQLQQTPKEFSNFVLLFLLDNIMNDSVAKDDNKVFSDIINIMKKDSRFKIRILKAFLKEIPMVERSRYSVVRKSFFDKNYTMGNSIHLVGRASKLKNQEDDKSEQSEFVDNNKEII